MDTKLGYFPLNECWKPQAQPVMATAFSILFVLIAAFVMLSLFIGAVCGGMSEALDKFKEDAEALKQEQEEREEHQRLLQQVESRRQQATEGSREAKKQGRQRGGGEEKNEDISAVEEGTRGDHHHQQQQQQQQEEEKEEEEERKKRLRLQRTREALELFARMQRGRNGDRQRWDFDLIDPGAFRGYLKLAVHSRNLADAPWFVNLVTFTIVMAGVVVGIQTELFEPGPSNLRQYPALDVMDAVILYIFTAEVVFKLVGEGDTPLAYFNDPCKLLQLAIVCLLVRCAQAIYRFIDRALSGLTD